jgi:Spy/CpxP family protein refolding chaperone
LLSNLLAAHSLYIARKPPTGLFCISTVHTKIWHTLGMMASSLTSMYIKAADACCWSGFEDNNWQRWIKLNNFLTNMLAAHYLYAARKPPTILLFINTVHVEIWHTLGMMASSLTSMYVKAADACCWSGFEDNKEWWRFRANELSHRQLHRSKWIWTGFNCT